MISDTCSDLQQLQTARAKFKSSLFARNTVIGYGYDWRMFSAWCERMGLAELPASPETVSLYLTYLLEHGKKISTATRRKSSIVHMHRKNGFATPATEEVISLLDGARRTLHQQTRQMRALTLENIRAMTTVLAEESSVLSVRNSAILTVGFASALRRSSLVDLRLDDVEFSSHGVILRIRHEKQDQEGRGRFVGLPTGKHRKTCPVRCLRAWLKVRGTRQPGPLFTHVGTNTPLKGEAIHRMVKACVKRIGLDPTNYGAHSLRAGFVTAAGEAGLSDMMIAHHTGHRTIQTLGRYFRGEQIWKSNVAGMIGL